MENKYKIDIAVVSFSLLVMIFLVGYSQPLVISPVDDFKTQDTEILFSIDKANKLVVDDNLEFSTPEVYEVYDGLKLDLNPGKYYWKVIGVTHSEIRTLVIESVVNLELVEEENSYSVINAGNVGLSIDVYDGEELMENKDLDVGEKIGLLGNNVSGQHHVSVYSEELGVLNE